MAGGPTINYRADIGGLWAFSVVPALPIHGDLPLFQGGFIGVDAGPWLKNAGLRQVVSVGAPGR
jgi:hypothetical protein